MAAVADLAVEGRGCHKINIIITALAIYESADVEQDEDGVPCHQVLSIDARLRVGPKLSAPRGRAQISPEVPCTSEP